mmetsp:Transcript_33163/g.80208  ORF Transcript_33163/g.80208 Transcript_33163/m.80208 type:complete len:366 (-) Transcript_33163:1484-2581(-)
MGARMIGRAHDERLVDGFALSQRVGDEHHRLLVERQIVHARPGSLHAEVVLILDVDRTVALLRDLDVVRRAFQTILAEALVDDIAVRMKHGVHVSRVGMMIVRVHRRGEDGIGQPSGGSVDVSHGIRGTRENDPIHVEDVVELVVHALPTVGQDLHLSHAGVLAQVYVPRELGEYLAYAPAGILPRLTRGDVTIPLATGRLEGSGVVLVREQRNLRLDERTEDGGEGPELVHEERRRVVRREHDLPPELGSAHETIHGVQRNDVHGIEQADARVRIVHARRIAPPPRRPPQGEQIAHGVAESHDPAVNVEISLEYVPQRSLVRRGVCRPQRPHRPWHLAVQEPRQGLMDRLHSQLVEKTRIILVK